MAKNAIIVGAGPAGLTLAWELGTRTDLHPVVLEKSEFMGGISRTVNYKGNRIDIGGHRFFSKSDRVMQWWFRVLPPEREGLDPDSTNLVMLVRSRKSRIYFLRRFFGPLAIAKLTAQVGQQGGLIAPHEFPVGFRVSIQALLDTFPISPAHGYLKGRSWFEPLLYSAGSAAFATGSPGKPGRGSAVRGAGGQNCVFSPTGGVIEPQRRKGRKDGGGGGSQFVVIGSQAQAGGWLGAWGSAAMRREKST